MRKRFYHERVCSCAPKEGMVFLTAKLLKDIVNREIHPIRCAATCGRKAQKGLLLSNLCAEAHHPMWALKILYFVLDTIHDKDYDDWVEEYLNPEWVKLRDVISNGICEVIGKRIDDLHRQCGLYDAKGMDSWEYQAGDGWYDYLSYVKYDNEWLRIREEYIEMREEAMSQQRTERIFKEGQGELPPKGQDFFYYWEDLDPTLQDLYFVIDDWS